MACRFVVVSVIHLLIWITIREARADDRVALAVLVDIAVQRSPQLAIARADHDEGRHRITSAGAVDDWHVLGKATAAESVVDRSLAAPGDAITSRSVAGELGILRSLSTGASIEALVDLASERHLYRSFATTSQIGTQQTDFPIAGTIARAKLVASQPLARGRGSAVARAAQKSARLDARALSAKGVDEAATTVRDLAIAYWELAYLAEQLAVDRDGETLAIKQAEITREVVRNGLQPPSAAKIAELKLALHRDAILRDRAAIVDQSLAMRRLVGLELVATPLVPADELAVPTTEWTESEAIDAALAHGPGMAELGFTRRVADVAVDVASDARVPRLDASLAAELSGVGSSADRAFAELGRAQMYSLIGGVTMQWDIGGSARAGQAAARVHRARLDAEHKDLEAKMTAAVLSSVRRQQLARQRVQVSQIAVDVAADALHAEVVAFQAGRSTNVAVFQREDDVSDAKLRLARARIDAIEASIDLDYLTGSLLRRFGVTLARSMQ